MRGPAKHAYMDDATQNMDRADGELAAPTARALHGSTIIRERNSGLIGSPRPSPRKLRAYAEEGLFNTLLGEFNFGVLDRGAGPAVHPALRRSFRGCGLQPY